MKRKIIEIECDVCHKDITNARKRYKFERRNNYLTQFFEPDPPKWTRLDMCESCFRKLRQFIRNEIADNICITLFSIKLSRTSD